jgi:hypothetical protein
MAHSPYNNRFGCVSVALGRQEEKKIVSLSGKCGLNCHKCKQVCSPTSGPASFPQGALVANHNPISNTQEVYYQCAHGDICLLYWSSAGGWHAQDLSTSAGAPFGIDRTALAVDYNPVAHTVEAAYLAFDQHIHQLWYNGTQWRTTDLTAVTQAPNAAIGDGLVVAPTSISADYNPSANRIELYWLSTDSHVRLFWYNGTWHTQDLTTTTGSPVAQVGSALGSGYNSISQTSEAYLFGRNKHLYQLYYGTNWHAQDMTSLTGTGNAMSGSPVSARYNQIANTFVGRTI